MPVACPHCGTTNNVDVASGHCAGCGRELSAAHPDLGELRQTFRSLSFWHWLELVAGFFCVLMLVGAAFFLLAVPQGDSYEWLLAGAVAGCLSAGYLVIFFMVWLPALEDLRLRIAVHAGGLRVQGRGDVDLCRWEDIEAVYHERKHIGPGEFPPRGYERFTVRLGDGRAFSWDRHLQRHLELGQVVQKEVTARLLPAVREKVRNGETLAFGRVRISRDGYTRPDGQTLPWSEIDLIDLRDGCLCVVRRGVIGAWSRVAMGLIPNLRVLLALVDEYHEDDS